MRARNTTDISPIGVLMLDVKQQPPVGSEHQPSGN